MAVTRTPGAPERGASRGVIGKLRGGGGVAKSRPTRPEESCASTTKTRIDKLKPDPSDETFVIQYGRDGRTRRYAIGTFGLPYDLKAPTNRSTNAKQSSFATTPSSIAASMPARVRA